MLGMLITSTTSQYQKPPIISTEFLGKSLTKENASLSLSLEMNMKVKRENWNILMFKKQKASESLEHTDQPFVCLWVKSLFETASEANLGGI